MTSVSALPTPWGWLDAALRARRPVWVSYHGLRRLVCPHALGWKAGRAMVLSYQTGGQTTAGSLDVDPARRWRCMFIDEIDDVSASDPASRWATPDNYNYSRPFPTIDELAIAISRCPQTSS